MATFAMDKLSQNLKQGAISAVSSMVQYQAPQAPETKKRIVFTKLGMVNGDQLPDVELYIDPQNLQIKKNVIQNAKLTKGGYAIQFWGHELTQATLQCTTGNFQPLYGVVSPAPISEKTTFGSFFNDVQANWAKGGGPLKTFEKIKTWVYQNRFTDSNRPYIGMPIIEMIWEDSVYQIYMTGFDYNFSADKPFAIMFNINMTILKRRDVSFSDIAGSFDAIKLAGDPVNTLVNTGKQASAVLISMGKKQLAQLQSSLTNSITNKIGKSVAGKLSKNLFNDLPSKITLW